MTAAGFAAAPQPQRGSQQRVSGTPASSGAAPPSYDSSGRRRSPSSATPSDAATTEPQSHAGAAPLTAAAHSQAQPAPAHQGRSQSRMRTQTQSQSENGGRSQTVSQSQGRGRFRIPAPTTQSQGRSQGSPLGSCPVCGLPLQLSGSDARTPAPGRPPPCRPAGQSLMPAPAPPRGLLPAAAPATPVLQGHDAAGIGVAAQPVAILSMSAEESSEGLCVIPETPPATSHGTGGVAGPNVPPAAQRQQQRTAEAMDCDAGGADCPPQICLELSSDGEVRSDP